VFFACKPVKIKQSLKIASLLANREVRKGKNAELNLYLPRALSQLSGPLAFFAVKILILFAVLPP
jgi:hypothetical protein